MTKALRKAIMKRSELASKYHKTKSIEDYNIYKKQRNFCSKLYKKERKKVYDNLDIKNITDNKKVWKTLKPLLSDKAKCGSTKINLVENDEILSIDKEIAEAFNNYYSNAVKSLNLQCDSEHLSDVSDETDPIERAIKKFKCHPSIINVNQNIPKTTNFEFSQTDIDSIKKMIDNLDSSQNGTFGGIPTNCLKGVSDISAKFLNSVWNNEVLKDLKFASGLTLADIVPLFKKDDSALVKNYRPVSLLPIKCLRELCLIKLLLIWMNIYHLISVAIEKVLVHKLLFLLLLRSGSRF